MLATRPLSRSFRAIDSNDYDTQNFRANFTRLEPRIRTGNRCLTKMQFQRTVSYDMHFSTRSLILAGFNRPLRCFALASRSVMTDLSFVSPSINRSAIHESIVDTIGNTPIVKLKRMSPKIGVDIYVKCESENPGGSVKDRLALGIIEWAEKHGQIQPGQVSLRLFINKLSRTSK